MKNFLRDTEIVVRVQKPTHRITGAAQSASGGLRKVGEAVVGRVCTGATGLVLLGSWRPGRGNHQGRVSIQVGVSVEEWWSLDPLGEMD